MCFIIKQVSSYCPSLWPCRKKLIHSKTLTTQTTVNSRFVKICERSGFEGPFCTPTGGGDMRKKSNHSNAEIQYDPL